MSAESSKPVRRGNRRVTAPGTSGQPEEREAEVYDPLQDSAASRPERSQDDRADWLRAERPPHW